MLELTKMHYINFSKIQREPNVYHLYKETWHLNRSGNQQCLISE